MASTRPDFRCSGPFSGEGSADKWLRCLDYDLECWSDDSGAVPPEKHLQIIDMLLKGEAEAWAATEELMQRAFENPTEENRQQAIAILKLRFPGPKPISTPATTVEEGIRGLAQRADEDTDDYYRRDVIIMRRMGGQETVKPPELT